MQLFMKLDDRYANVRSNILMMQPLPNVSLTYRLLIQEEKQIIVASIGDCPPPMAFVAKDKTRYTPYIGSNFRDKPYQFNSTVGRGSWNRKTYFCKHCKMTGHSIER